jgi:hypothetical protein
MKNFQSLMDEAICSLERALSRDLDFNDKKARLCAIAAMSSAHYIYGYIDAKLGEKA